ncbi:connector enhancer of kinase suppressor of ras 2-like [Platysternon megacephalum]|uniref:Connector enhancer of kinase suppressor of ras 2-like n=1 Tax=Platysternon megacephalum TaxID=55544 RepID=A0A4D9ETV2_9SAUR|nr:connector enhancer of kinase suppressor of ras 2-like [Platysternon megacephalum]
MGQRFQALRCFSCGTFQVHQVKKSKKWSCKVCGEKQMLLKVYGQGSGSDCRRHVQKLNLLRAGMEVAAEGTSCCIEEPVNNDKENTGVPQEENVGWQEEDVEFSPSVSRWNKYLDKDSEDQEEEVYTDREQMYSHKRNIVEEQRKRKSSFLHNDAQECFEEKGIYGLTGQAKKVKTFESRKDSTTVADQDCGDYICNSVVVPAINEFWVPENAQAPESANVTVSKWEKFLLSPSSCNNGNITFAAQKSSWKLETQRASAGNFLMSDGYPQQEEDSESPGTGAQTEKSFTNNKHTAQKYASKLHSTTLAARGQTAFDVSHAAIGDVLSGKYKDCLIRAGSGVAENNEGRLCLADTVMPANCLSKDAVTFASTDPFASSSGVPQSLTAPSSSFFCTDDDFDDDL